jgi:nucleotide-binding universal stress UspA family protein
METAKGFKRILLATDGSEQSNAAADAAISFASASSAEVRVVHVWNLEVHHRHGYWDVEVRSEAERLVGQIVTRLVAAGVRADQEICRADSGHVAGALSSAAREFDADLVIVGSRALSDWQSMLKHSVSHQLLCSLRCPLLVVHSGPTTIGSGGKRVLLAIAGGDDIGPCVRAAAAAAAAPGSEVLTVHVRQAYVGAQGFAYVEPEEEVRATMARTVELLQDAGVKAVGVVAHAGPVAGVVVELAASYKADVIVTGSGRAGDLSSLLLGSVSHQLMHSSERPVLIAGRVGA